MNRPKKRTVPATGNGCKEWGWVWLVLWVNVCWAQVDPPASETTELTLLTWNIQLLPRGAQLFSRALRKRQKERLPYIIEHCLETPYDVIVFQEAFDAPLLRKLRKTLEEAYPHQITPLRRFGCLTNSGILIVSRHQLEYVDDVVYPKGKGADAMAAKGCTLARLTKEGRTLYLAGTHLQAGGGEAAQKERTQQYRAIATLIERQTHQDSHPIVLTGDLNTRAGTATHADMLTALNAVDKPLDEERPYTIDERNTWVREGNNAQLDYVLLVKGRAEATLWRQTILRLQRTWAGHRRDLSDHYGIVAQIRW